jgi:hypothetical protein
MSHPLSDRPAVHLPSVRPALTVCWAAKGGSGTTVVAAALAVSAAGPTVIVDLAGDLPAVFGVEEPAGPGVLDWVWSDAPAERLRDLTVPVAGGVHLVPRGHGTAPSEADRWQELATELTRGGTRVIVDAGTGCPPAGLHAIADQSLLVTRACYVGLRRAIAAPVRPSAVVLVEEAGRSLRAVDVEAAVGAPVVATVSVDPAVARAVDAGLLSARLPRVLQRDLRGAA